MKETPHWGSSKPGKNFVRETQRTLRSFPTNQLCTLTRRIRELARGPSISIGRVFTGTVVRTYMAGWPQMDPRARYQRLLYTLLLMAASILADLVWVQLSCSKGCVTINS